jgi:hypothetical protein
MGKTFVDTYSLLHFATGIVAYYFGIPLIWWIILHAVFEILENSPEGVYFIDNYLIFWPGGKKYPDSVINSLGDEVFAVLGWLLPYFLFHNK